MKNSKQMELITSTSSQEDTLANLSPLQVTKKVSKIRDISGQSILDLSKSVDRLGSLEKTLVDTLNSVLTPYSRTWRVKVTPQGRLVFQLLASVPTTKEKGSGLLPTPTTDSANNRTKKYAQGGTPLTMAIQTWPTPQHTDHLMNKSETLEAWEKRAKKKKEQGINLQFALRHAIQRWPTPTSRDWKDQIGAYPPSTNVTRGETLMNAVTRRSWPTPAARDWKDTGENTNYEKIAKKGKLAGAVKMWPTPNASDNRDRGNLSDPAIQRRIAMGKQVGLTMAVKEKKGGGTLNPTWVEWLMGYPTGWTDLNPSETASSLTSPTTSDNQSLKVWRTPTAMDSGINAEKYAARMLVGKNKRSSNQPVQKTLSMEVAMENLKNKPGEVKKILSKEMITRPNLPPQKEFVEYLRSQITSKELSSLSGIDYTTVEHWFRKGQSFSHPSIKHWNHIKKFLKEIKYDEELTKTESIEWSNE